MKFDEKNSRVRCNARNLEFQSYTRHAMSTKSKIFGISNISIFLTCAFFFLARSFYDYLMT
jgi:hypothetical protein